MAEATTFGIPETTAQQFLATVEQDRRVLRADRAQGVFQRPFIDFSRRLISQTELTLAARVLVNTRPSSIASKGI